jgi:LDH2 family malate/lactate/ureidoglycolate dehydrogenase
MTNAVDVPDLHRFATDVLVAAGLDTEQAERAAEVLCFADRRGHTTHGTYALSTIYVPRLRDGQISTAATSKIVRSGTATRLLDGQRRLGLVVGTEAMNLAVELAGEHGTGIVAVRNSTHFGSAGYYAHHASQQGKIGMAMTNCGAQGVAPPIGGTHRMFGTNPIGMAVPTAGSAPFVLDMSTTVVATGKLRAAQLRGENVPEGWLRSTDGSSTVHPDDYYAGTAQVQWLGGDLATGGAKGFGLGLLVEMLAGVLPGAAVGADPESSGSASDHNIGHFFLAVEPEAFVGAADFTGRADQVLDAVVTSPRADAGIPVQYPGLPEADRTAAADRDGIALPEHVLDALDKLAADFDVLPPVRQVLR